MNGYLDGRVEPARRLSRFLVFGLIALIAVGGLTARLFYLQVASGTAFSTLSAQNRTVLQAIASPRGLIYDRKGRLLVTNVPTFTVKIRPSDLPQPRREEVVRRLAALTGVEMADDQHLDRQQPGVGVRPGPDRRRRR